jgi:hypothetical protein
MRDKLTESRFKLKEHVRVDYRAVAEEGCSIETVLDPTYLAHVAERLRPGDEITFIAEDGSFRVDVEVVDTAVQWVKTRVLHKWEWSKEDKAPSEDKPQKVAPYEPVWKGPQNLWCILRTSDDVIVQEKINDKQEAKKIAANYQPKSV